METRFRQGVVMMKIWFKKTGDNKPSFFSDENNKNDRPDENYFVSDIPTNWFVSLYSIIWDGETPTLIKDSNYNEEKEKIDIEDERKFKLNEIPSEYIERFETSTGKIHKGLEWEAINYSRILNKKIDGAATIKQLILLNVVDTLRSGVESIEDYLESEDRTLVELQSYDVTDDLHWE